MGDKHGVDSKGKGLEEASSSSMVQNHIGGGGGEEIVSVTWPLDDLPMDCISNIISFTSPRDACFLSSVSETFKSAVNSDIVWEKFLPSDYQSLVPSWQEFSSKKDLYFALCNNPVLIDDGKKSFWLEKASGKKCVMLAPRELRISGTGHNSHWKWISIPESRFGEVPKLLHECWFQIRAKMPTSYLSPRTRYSGYIVFKKDDLEVGEESFQRFVSFVGPAGDKSSNIESRTKPKERKDGWMETELCEFFNEACCDRIIKLTVLETKSPCLKPDLIIQGIEFRPSKNT